MITQARVSGPGAEATPSPDEIGGWFAERAEAVDRGEYDTREALRWLGERGLLDPGAGDLADRVELVERIAGECLSSAFSLWAHLMVIEYLAGDPGGDLVAGRRVGATAMAPALRDVAGLEPVPVVAERTATGLRLNGPIRWASNLFDDATVVLPVRLGAEARAVVRVGLADPGVSVAQRPTLLALNGTASSSARLTDVEVPDGAILAEDLPGFVGRIRPAFLLLQSAFCTGLAVRSAREAGRHTGGPNTALSGEVGAATERVADVRRRLHDTAAAPARARPAELLRLRLDAAEIATRATRAEATVRGGAGYLAGSPVSRRLREAAFLPIQAPTEGQLRWELSRYG